MTRLTKDELIVRLGPLAIEATASTDEDVVAAGALLCFLMAGLTGQITPEGLRAMVFIAEQVGRVHLAGERETSDG